MTHAPTTLAAAPHLTASPEARRRRRRPAAAHAFCAPSSVPHAAHHQAATCSPSAAHTTCSAPPVHRDRIRLSSTDRHRLTGAAAEQLLRQPRSLFRPRPHWSLDKPSVGSRLLTAGLACALKNPFNKCLSQVICFSPSAGRGTLEEPLALSGSAGVPGGVQLVLKGRDRLHGNIPQLLTGRGLHLLARRWWVRGAPMLAPRRTAQAPC